MQFPSTFTAALFLLAPLTATAATLPKRQNAALKKGGQTLVLKEQGGVPGNECLTFRNNGM